MKHEFDDARPCTRVVNPGVRFFLHILTYPRFSPPIFPLLAVNSDVMHSSVQSHLTTEISLLDSLRLRSQHQHRSQPFLSRIQQVVRLSRLLQQALSDSSESRIARLLPRVSRCGVRMLELMI